MIDSTTLPRTQAYQRIEEGTKFVIKGKYFNSWPNEIVLSYYGSNALNDEINSPTIFILIAKTNTEMTFEVTQTYQFGVAHTWLAFASPFNKPRNLLPYELNNTSLNLTSFETDGIEPSEEMR